MTKKFQNFKKKLGKTIVTIAMVVMLSTIAVNAQTLNKTTANLNMREGASTSTKVLQVIKKGELVEVIQKNGNWSQVSYNGTTGYVYNKYLSGTTAKTGVVKVGNSRLNVRTKPSMSGKIIGKLYTGNKVEIKGESGNWYEINYNGKTAYISKNYVKVSSTTIVEVEKCSDFFKAQIQFYVRSGPSTSYTQIGTLTKGQVFQVQGECSNGWYQIKYGSKTGYISNKYLDVMKDGSKDPAVIGVAKVNTNSQSDPYLAIRQGQGTNTKKLDNAKTGTMLEILEDSNPVKNWTKVRYNNLTGYVYNKYLVKDEAPVIDCVDELTVYVGDKITSDLLNLRVTDKEDGDLTDKAVVDTSKVDTTKSGLYQITITVKDSFGNGINKTVKVTVKEKEVNEAPVITASDVTLNIGESFDKSMLNVKAQDKEDGDLTDKLTIETSEVNTSKVGTYKVYLDVTDSKGEKTTKTVTVTVKATKPVVSASNVTITEGDSLEDSSFKASAKDCEGTELAVTIDKSSVDFSKVGTYTVTVSATDKWGNTTTNKVQVTVEAKKVQGYEVNSTECRAVIQKEMYRLVNAHRANNNRAEYTISSSMQNTAWIKSKDMAVNNYFAHKLNDKYIWEYEDCAEADVENIALSAYNLANKGYMTESECESLAGILFNIWKESSGHNANMLSKDLKSIGFDLYMIDKNNGSYTVYATQEFTN